ncbi:MAG: hypothetical protein LBV67_09475 [Streptococcaceae bacterium]|jgi:hypothetical protein|nr:hypothetical protein [Streptococcaceae bacterium]
MSNINAIVVRTPRGEDLETSFGRDFAIANRFGEYAVRDTYKRAINEWLSDVDFVKELVLVLNLYCNLLYGNEETNKLAHVYHELYYDARDKAWDFHGDNAENANILFDYLD